MTLKHRESQVLSKRISALNSRDGGEIGDFPCGVPEE